MVKDNSIKINLSFSQVILDWYYLNKRELPWRESKEPYKIWLSEIILQQTRISQGLPYYEKFVDNLASIEDFAKASPNKILKLWQGLGYYSRARNMHVCAQMVVSEYGGSFPSSYDELIKLKGIGKYTAAAIASICFDEPIPSIDGNVFRLLSRVFGLSDDISKGKTFAIFFEKALSLLPRSSPGDFNQAMMEFGAVVCVPKNPNCSQCVFERTCIAYNSDLILSLPVKSKKVKVRQRFMDYYLFRCDDQVLLRQRSSGDIWEGLYEFMLIESKKQEEMGKFEVQDVVYSSEMIKHQLTHQKLYIYFHIVDVFSKDNMKVLAAKYGMFIVHLMDFENFPVPKPIEQFFKKSLV